MHGKTPTSGASPLSGGIPVSGGVPLSGGSPVSGGVDASFLPASLLQAATNKNARGRASEMIGMRAMDPIRCTD
jgi:hypothetical protein